MQTDTIAGETTAIAEFVANHNDLAIPESVIDRTRECLLDFIGNAAYAGRFVDSSRVFRTAVNTLASTGECTVLGDTYTYPPQYAALLNGAFAHTLDFDDTNLFGSLHAGAPVIAAVLADAERFDVCGESLIRAIAIGMEVACRVGAALGTSAYDRGFHITAVAGIFGAIAGASCLRNFSVDTVESAFGIGASQAAGSMQYLSNGAWNKRLHPGFAAHNALVSVALAEAGMLGASAAFEGQYGFLNAYSNSPQLPLLTGRLGSWWANAQTAIKPYPSCRFAHAAIDAALELRQRLDADFLKEVQLDLRLPRKAMDIVGVAVSNKLVARNIVDGQFSVYFQVATAWLDGEFTWQSYERLGDADVDATAAQITVTVDDSLPFAGAVLAIRGKPALTVKIDEPLGEPSRPLGWEGVERKYMTLAVPVFGAEEAQTISRLIRQLESLDSCALFWRLLRGQGVAG